MRRILRAALLAPVVSCGAIADQSIAKEDGWMFLALEGQLASGDKINAARLGAYAKGAAVTIEIVEFN